MQMGGEKMIKLTKSSTVPPTLMGQSVQNEKNVIQTKIRKGQKPESKDFKYELYGAQDVKDQLRKDQHDKCIFCECTLLDKDGGEVEHFRPKTAYRQDKIKGSYKKPAYYLCAYEWENLSLSCHACNRRKHVFFPLFNPNDRFTSKENPILINPFNVDPAAHLEFKRYEVFPKFNKNGNKDEMARWMIEELDMLNRPDLVELRKRRYEEFLDEMEEKGITFDDLLKQKEGREIKHGRSPECIEFYGMFTNQKIKF